MKKIFLMIVTPISIASAETFELLSDLPIAEGLNNITSDGGGLGVFTNFLFQASIAIGSALAVIMLIVAGTKYATSVIPGVKNDAKEKMIGAIGGLLLLLSTYIILNEINPDLVKLDIERQTISLDAQVGEIVDANAFEGVDNEEGKTTRQLAQEIEQMSQEEYIQQFGRAAFDRLPDGRKENGVVQLTTREQSELAQILFDQASSDSGGSLFRGDSVDESIIEQGGGNGGDGGNGSGKTSIPEESIQVTSAGQKMVLAAIKSKCSDEIPESWAGSKGLWTIVQKESQGIIGRNNYTIVEYAKAKNLSLASLQQEIKANTFKKNHCCSSGRCSGLREHNARQAAAGVKRYKHIAGKCTSASGFGQLTMQNMEIYQPGGVSGYLDASSEICGMLKYIKSRYKTPTKAAERYVNGLGY